MKSDFGSRLPNGSEIWAMGWSALNKSIVSMELAKVGWRRLYARVSMRCLKDRDCATAGQ